MTTGTDPSTGPAKDQLPESYPDSLVAAARKADAPPAIVDAMNAAVDGHRPEDLLGDCPYQSVLIPDFHSDQIW